MRISFELNAEPRGDQGKGASRRLRHSGKVPAILYGGHADARNLALDHNKLMGMIDNEKFYSSIISVNVGAEKQPAIVKDVQMHPARTRRSACTCRSTSRARRSRRASRPRVAWSHT
jgi:large subunit ribosomal protein L25